MAEPAPGPVAGPVAEPPGRLYGGRTEAQRRADRRDRLLQAGLQLFGTLGWNGASVERLCTTAGVATRAFYEEFSSRETLLLTVYQGVMDEASAAVAAALAGTAREAQARVRSGVSAYVGYMTADARRARVAHREVRVAGVLEEQRRAAFLSFVVLVERETAAAGRRTRGRLTALALAGAVNELLIDWVAAPEPRPPVAPLVDEMSLLFLAALDVPG